jgi:uncharacterized protein YciI
MGGPFEGAQENLMVLKSGTTLEEAKKVSAADPTVKSGFLKAEILRWLLFIDNTKAAAKKKPGRKER